MQPRTLTYYRQSDVFADLDLAWSAFIDSDPDVTWGETGSVVLAEARIIIRGLTQMHDDADDDTQHQIIAALARLNTLPPATLINVEE
jgi:hypothetical protein